MSHKRKDSYILGISAFYHDSAAALVRGGEILAAAQEASPLDGRVVVRLKGRNADSGREILKEQGFEVFEDLDPALDVLTAQTGVRADR